MAIFGEMPSAAYFAALVLMIIGAWLSAQDKPLLKKTGRKKNGVRGAQTMEQAVNGCREQLQDAAINSCADGIYTGHFLPGGV